MPTVSQIFKAIITADSSGAVKDLRKFDGEVEKVAQGSAKRFDAVKGAAVAIGGAAVVAGFRSAINQASDLEESANAVRVVFGDAAEAVLGIGEGSAQAMGLARSEFNQAAVGFAGFAERIAGPGDNVAEIVRNLTQRAADFASVMNLDVNEAVRVFMSTLAGETEPIRKFGEDISAAAVEQHLLAEGVVSSKAEITDALKVQGRYSLLMRDTADVAGDFANTSESVANQQRVLQAELKDTAADIGTDLLPVAAELLGTLRDIVQAADDIGLPRGIALLAEGISLAVGDSSAAAGGVATLVSQLDELTASDRLGAMARLSDEVGESKNALEKFGRVFAIGLQTDQSKFQLDDFRTAFEKLRKASPEAASQVVRDLELVRREADNGNESAKQYVDTLGLTDDAIREMRVSVTDFLPEIGSLVQEQILAAHAAEVQERANVRASEALRDEAKAANHAADQIARLDRLHDMAATSTENHRKAIEDLFDAVNDALDSTFDYEKALLDVEDAVADLADTQAEAIRIQNDAEASDRDKEQALRDLRNAQIDTAESIRDAAEAYAREQGAVDGSIESYLLQAEALREMQGEYPHLRGEIGLYIDELNRIPAVKTTQLIVTRNSTNAQLRSVGATSVTADEHGNLTGGLLRKSVGGRIPGVKGEPVLMIGHAGETVLPTHQPLPAVSRDGGLHIGSISVVSQSGEVAPRDIVQAIARYERMNGPRYQAA